MNLIGFYMKPRVASFLPLLNEGLFSFLLTLMCTDEVHIKVWLKTIICLEVNTYVQ